MISGSPRRAWYLLLKTFKCVIDITIRKTRQSVNIDKFLSVAISSEAKPLMFSSISFEVHFEPSH